MMQQIIQNSNKLNTVLRHLCQSFKVIRVIKVRKLNDYIKLYILMIFCVEITLQMIQNMNKLNTVLMHLR
jgi:hypothetical protein